jgi:ankyrin repeat protein
MNNLLFFLLLITLNSCRSGTGMSAKNMQDTMIIEAVKNNQLAAVAAGLEKGTDVNTRDRQNKSLLLIATENGDLEMARLLVGRGADVNLQDQRLESPFLTAGASGKAELVRLFLEHGARFDVFNRYNGTALIPACERAHLDVVKILANTKGFPVDHVNRLGWTALMEAVVLGDGSDKYAEIVQVLVDAGCNTAIPDNKGITALQHAQSGGYTRIVKILEGAR